MNKKSASLNHKRKIVAILVFAVILITSGLAGYGGLDAIYEQLIRQASMMSFNDSSYILSVFLILILPLVFLMKKGESGG